MTSGIFSMRSLWLSVVLLAVLFFLPAIIPRFYTYILTVIFVTSLLAMSLNLVVGHGGLFQFHHAAFYGVGAYTFALFLTKTSLPTWVAPMRRMLGLYAFTNSSITLV